MCLKDQDWKMFGLKLNKCDLQNLKTWVTVAINNFKLLLSADIPKVSCSSSSSSKSLLYVTFRHKRSFKRHCNTIKTL